MFHSSLLVKQFAPNLNPVDADGEEAPEHRQEKSEKEILEEMKKLDM